MKESVRIIRFALIGTLNALITAAVIWLLLKVAGCNYLWSNVAAYLAAQANNFFWSKYWIFSSASGKFRREIPLFLIAFGCAYASQFVVLLILVEGFGMNPYPAQFLGLFVYGFVNFLMNRRLTFRNR